MNIIDRAIKIKPEDSSGSREVGWLRIGLCQPIIWPTFPEICMNMKKIERGWVSKILLFRSATGQGQRWCWKSVSRPKGQEKDLMFFGAPTEYLDPLLEAQPTTNDKSIIAYPNRPLFVCNSFWSYEEQITKYNKSNAHMCRMNELRHWINY